jgi:hypothetical protein
MSLIVNSGYKSLNLYFTKPSGGFFIDDNTTAGAQQSLDNSLRTDIDNLYIWVSETNNFVASELNLVYKGNFLDFISITKINVTTDLSAPEYIDLIDNKTYYIRYAITSTLDPSLIVKSIQQVGTTLDISLEIQGWLTRDPVEIETDAEGDPPTPFPTFYTGTFTVYKYSSNITTADSVQYSIVANSSIGGVTAEIITTDGDSSKGRYRITGISDLVGNITLRAVYTDPLNSSRVITIDKILNVSKRRPGASASIVELSGNGIAFVKTANSGETLPLTREISATVTNIPSPIYTWYEVGVTDTPITFLSGQTNSNSHPGLYTRDLSKLNELTVNKTIFNNVTSPATKTIRVVVTSNTNTNIEVSDTFTYYYLQEGSDALVLGLENENQSISFTGNLQNSIILNSATPITTKLILVRGNIVINPLLTDPTSTAADSLAVNKISTIVFSASSSDLNVTNITINQTSGEISIPRNTTLFPPDSFLSAEITFTATVTFISGSVTTLNKKLVINAVFDGGTGEAYWLVNNPKILIKQKDGNLNFSSISWTAKKSINGTVANYTTGYFKVYKDTTLLATPANYSVLNGTVTVSSLDKTAGYYRLELYSDSAFTKLIDQDDIQIYEESNDGVVVFNDNKDHIIIRSTSNDITYLGTGTYFYVQQGENVFTANIAGATYAYNTVQKKLAVSKTITSKQFYIKSIVFGPGLTVTIPSGWNWGQKFTIRNNTDLIWEDWSNITLDDGVTQAYVQFEIAYSKAGTNGDITTEISTQRIAVAKDSSTIVVDIDNDNHQIPFTTSNTGIYNNSGTKIQVFDTTQELQYVSTNATLVKGQWKITQAIGTDIASPSIPTQPALIGLIAQKYAEIADHTGMSANAQTAKIEYRISARTNLDVLVTGIIARQTFVKVLNATAIYRLVGTTSILRFNNGTFSSLTVSAQKLEGGINEVFAGWFSYCLKLPNETLTQEEPRTQNLTISLPPNTVVSTVIVKLYREETGGTALDSAELPIIPQPQDGLDGNIKPWIVKTSDYTAESGDRIIADTKLAYQNNTTFTITLPYAPVVGTSVTITDGWNFAQKNLIVGRNSSLIVNAQQIGEDRDINLDVQNTTYEFIYTGPTRGWDFTATAGPKGEAGNDATLLTLEYTDLSFIYDSYNSTDTSTPSAITFTASKQNIQGTVTFIARAYDENNVDIGPVTLTGSGDTRTLSATNFNTISGVANRLNIRYVKVTASLTALNSNEVFTDTVTINRLDNGSDALVHQLTNESHILAASATGVVSSYSGASTFGYLYLGAVNETMNWSITKSDSTGLTTQLIKPEKISTSGTISNISGNGTSGSPWTATVSNMSTTTGLVPGDIISALENNTGRLYGGNPSSITVETVNQGTKTITYRVIGGTTPIAGVVGGIAKGHNRYQVSTTNLTDNVAAATSTITASKGLTLSEKVFSIAKSKEGSIFLILDLSNDNANVATLNDGTGGNYSLATTTVTALVGSVNVLPTISNLTITPSTGVTFSYTKNTDAAVTGLNTATAVPISPIAINNLSVNITNLTPDNGKLTISITYLGTVYSTDFTVTKAKVGPTGEPALMYTIEADSEIQYDPNTETFSPSTVVINAYRTSGNNIREDFTQAGYVIRFQYSSNKTTWTTVGSDVTASSRTLIPNNSLPKTTKFFQYLLIKTDVPEVILDKEIDVINYTGTNSSTVTIDIDNDTHQIPFSTDGTAVSYVESGTVIQVFDNTTELQYVTSNNLAAGEWTFTDVSGRDITPSFSINNIAPNYGKPPEIFGQKYAKVADHSAMLANTASVTYTIKAINTKGLLVESIRDTQTFTKVIRTAVYRIVGVGPITKTRLGVFSSLTVKGQKIEAGVTSDFGVVSSQLLGVSGAVELGKTSNSLLIKPPDWSTTTGVKVRLYSGNNSSVVLDEAELKILYDGIDGATVTVDVSNDTHDLPSDSDGNVINWDNSGTIIQVFLNATELQYVTFNAAVALTANQWRISNIVASTGFTPATRPAAISGQLYATIGNHSALTAGIDTATVNYYVEAHANGLLVTGLLGSQTFTKVRRTAVYRITNTEVISVTKNGAVNNLTISSQKIDGNTIEDHFGWITEQLDSGPVSARIQLSNNSGYITTATNTTKKVTIRLYATSNDTILLDTAEIKVVNDGIDGTHAAQVSYSNGTHLVPVTPLPNWSGSGGVIKVYDGSTTLTLKSTNLVTSPTYPTEKGYYYLAITKVSGDTLTVGSLSTTNFTDVTLAQWAGTLTQPTVYRITAYIRTERDFQVSVSTDATLVYTRDPVIYKLIVNPLVVNKAPNAEVFSPASISVNMYRTIGEDTVLYSTPLISIDSSTDGTNYGAPSSYNNEHSLSYTIPQNTRSIRIRAYNSAAINQNYLIDSQIVSITISGAQGVQGVGGTGVKDVTFNVADGYIKKLADGSLSPSSIAITATPSPDISNPTYAWTVTDPGNNAALNRLTTNGPGNTTTLTIGNTITAMVRVTCEVRENGTRIFDKTVSFIILTDGIDGKTGLRTATGYIYYKSEQVAKPADPSSQNVSYQFTTGTFSGGDLANNGSWSKDAPIFDPTNSSNYWVATYTAVENSPASNSSTGNNLTFGVATKTIGFSGIVTFSSLQTAGATIINGDNITTGKVKAAYIATEALQVKDSAGNVVFTAGINGGFTGIPYASITGSKPPVDATNGMTAAEALTLGNKLNKAAADTLTGAIHVSTNGSIWVGSSAPTWNGQAANDPNNNTSGILISPNGIVGIKSGNPQFVLKNDGEAIFRGTMTAGKITDGSGKFIIDLDQKYILIES